MVEEWLSFAMIHNVLKFFLSLKDVREINIASKECHLEVVINFCDQISTA